MTSTPVLIVGAGISGLCLALTLLKNGISVRIIDKEDAPKAGIKGVGVQARTVEVHKLLGTFDDLPNNFHELKVYIHDRGAGDVVKQEQLMAKYVPGSPAFPYRTGLQFAQDEHEALFRAHLEKYNCSVEFGTELVNFEQHDDHVIVHVKSNKTSEEETTQCQWLAGCDGPSSIVRKKLGIPFVGTTEEERQMLVGDAQVKGELSRGSHLWGPPTNLVGLAPIPMQHNPNNIMGFRIRGDVDYAKLMEDPQNIIDHIHTVTGRHDIVFEKFRWYTLWRPNIRMVERLVSRRVLLAGDAAHCHSPMGGQGLNSGIQDAFNLGWKLSLILKGLSPLSLIESYTAERIPVIAAMLNKTTELLNTAMPVKADKPVEYKNFQHKTEFNMLGINYRGSPICLDERTLDSVDVSQYDAYGNQGEGGEDMIVLRAGDRAPDAPRLVVMNNREQQRTTRLFDIFGATHHTILVFGEKSATAAILDVVKKYPADIFRVIICRPSASSDKELKEGFIVVKDEENHAHKTYLVPGQESGIFVVRPDGILGGIVDSSEGLERYMKLVFM